METKRKTQHEIIDETANFYNLGNRSVVQVEGNDKPICVYVGENGKQCAFARLMIDPSQAREGDTAWRVLENLGQECLKEEYRGYDRLFYDSIQSLHDDETNWMEGGLSNGGLRRVELLKIRYNES